MNDMEYIVQKLIDLGWEDCNGEFFSNDGRFKADITENHDIYIVRVALVGIFDRWVNSGVERIFDSKENAIHFFKNKMYMAAAYEEALSLIEENLADYPSTSIIKLMNKIIDMSIDWFHEV